LSALFGFALAPSTLWSNKHVIIQACRDTEIAHEVQFKQAVDETPLSASADPEVQFRTEEYLQAEGKLTHFMYLRLRNYFGENTEVRPGSDNDARSKPNTNLSPIDTYSRFYAEVISSGQQALEPQHAVCFIGEARQQEKLFSHDIKPLIPGGVVVEASNSKEGKTVLNVGFAGALVVAA